MNTQDNQPNWHQIAEKFDIWLPQLAPVGEALLTALAAQPGERVLDLASGTGEPALTLAQRLSNQVNLSGVDAADGMVQVARTKAAKLGLSNITFETMPAEQLRFDDNSFDRALCRFGVMLFQDPLKGLTEMRRVLKPKGRFALAVWNTPETMPTLHWAYKVFAPRLPADQHPPLAKITSLGGPGVLEDLLRRAGFTDLSVETRVLHYQFASFKDYWDTVEASDVLKVQFDALRADERRLIRNEVGQFAQAFVGPEGLRIPHEYRLASGIK